MAYELVASPTEDEPGQSWTPERSVRPSADLHRQSSSGDSQHSDDTLHDQTGNASYDPRTSVDHRKPRWATLDGHSVSKLATFGKFGNIFAWRFLLVLAWIELCTGVLVYTGIGQGPWVFGMLAHVIKVRSRLHSLS